MPRGDRVVHVAQVDSRYLLGTRDWTRLDVPPHASSLGKVLYAYDALPLPPGELATATTERTAARPDRAARASWREVRRRGYATTVDELELGLTGIAAPVRDGARRR